MTDQAFQLKKVKLTPAEELDFIRNITKEKVHYYSTKDVDDKPCLLEVYGIEPVDQTEGEYNIAYKKVTVH